MVPPHLLGDSIMKARKTMKNQPLIQEVISQISQRFTPKIPDIKKAIDTLLEKEYIERVDGTRDTFAYVAWSERKWSLSVRGDLLTRATAFFTFFSWGRRSMVARARDPPPPPSLTVVDTTNTTQPPLLPFVVHDSLHPLLITYVAYIPLPITLRKRPSRASPLRLVLKTACEVIGEEVRMSRKLYHVFYEDTMLLPTMDWLLNLICLLIVISYLDAMRWAHCFFI